MMTRTGLNLMFLGVRYYGTLKLVPISLSRCPLRILEVSGHEVSVENRCIHYDNFIVMIL